MTKPTNQRINLYDESGADPINSDGRGGGRGEGAEYLVESATSRHISNTYASLDRPFVESQKILKNKRAHLHQPLYNSEDFTFLGGLSAHFSRATTIKKKRYRLGHKPRTSGPLSPTPFLAAVQCPNYSPNRAVVEITETDSFL